MNIEAALEANPELSESGEPGMRAFDHPTMPPKAIATFDTTTRDTCLDAALSQITSTARKVIPFVSVQFGRPLARLTSQASHGRDGIKRGLECHRIVPVGSRDRNV
ncbi:hypothetical protein Bpla01_67040 [Burkholderia plantarii]|nr:hypothetical protein Bpla01_67040 [Burkholderia plantarii]